MSEEIIFITLRCCDCELDKCIYCPKGRWVKGKEGCTRKVNEKIAAQFQHYMKEVIPFWKTYTSQQVKSSYKEIIDFLFKSIYSAPIGQRLDPEGKVRLKGY